MKAYFDERGRLVATDYYQSAEYQANQPCCIVRDGIWHLFLPERCPILPSQRHAYAMPVTAKSERDGWVWRVMMRPAWGVKLPPSCFVPPAPELPNFGDEFRESLYLYGLWLPGLNDSPLGGDAPEPIFRGSLTVVRITVEEKLRRGGKLPTTYK